MLTYYAMLCVSSVQLRRSVRALRALLYMQEAHHCLFSILPVENVHDHELRERGHNFVLPPYDSKLFQTSFLINVCLVSCTLV